MSHTTKIKSVPIRSVSAMRSAVAELKTMGIACHLEENTIPRMYYNYQHKACAYVLKMDDCKYDVGLDLQKDGTCAPVFDSWRGYVEKVLGSKYVTGKTKPIAKFLRAYTKAATIESAVEQGYCVDSVTEDASGELTVTISTGLM